MNLTIDLKRLGYIGNIPVVLDEAKTQLHITYSEDNAEIIEMIKRAISQIETHCNISIVPQRIQWIADLESEWKLPLGPVIGIESVENRDSNAGSGVGGFSTTTTTWVSFGDSFDPVVYCNRYRITYTAGMPTLSEDLRQAILKQVVWLFEHKGDEGLDGLSKEVKDMVEPYRVMIWA
jgi:hypothetical protein